jgi:ABC-type transport system involved in cytochrome c biogenesis permease component
LTARSTSTQATPWYRQARILFLKDVRAEARTKVAISSVGIFAFASLMLIALATRTLKEALTINLLALPETITQGQIRAQMVPAWEDPSKLGLLWILLCFAAFAGLSHSFVHEEEAGTTAALRMTMQADAVYAGKLVFNLGVIVATALVVTPAYMLLTGMHSGPPVAFALLMFGGCLGLAACATIVAALAAKAKSTGALFGAIGLPLLIVFLIMLLNGATTLYAADSNLIRTVKDLGGLLSYGVLIIAVSAITFHYVWED